MGHCATLPTNPGGYAAPHAIPAVFSFSESPTLSIGWNREVEVEFFCSPSARPAMVYGIRVHIPDLLLCENWFSSSFGAHCCSQESSTCNYVITVGTSLLCPHPEFRVEDKAEHPITCKHLDNFHRDESSQELDIEPPPLLLQSEGELEEGKGQFMK